MKKVSLIVLIISLFLGGIYLYHSRELTRFDLQQAFRNVSEEMSITLNESSHLFLYNSALSEESYLMVLDMNPRNRIRQVVKLDKYYSNIDADESDPNRIVIKNNDNKDDVLIFNPMILGESQKLIKNKYIDSKNKTKVHVGGKNFDLLLFQLSGVYNQELGFNYEFAIDSSVLIDEQKYQPIDFMPINYLHYLHANGREKFSFEQ